MEINLKKITEEQYHSWIEHANTFPQDSRLLKLFLRIPVIYIIPYEYLIYNYQDNPLANDRVKDLKNSVRSNLQQFSTLILITDLFMFAIGIELPIIAAAMITGAVGLSLAHFAGRAWLHKDWNTFRYMTTSKTKSSGNIRFSKGNDHRLYEIYPLTSYESIS